eukprot:jgi/Botrbrau1/14998/Bobra.0018s0098.1
MVQLREKDLDGRAPFLAAAWNGGYRWARPHRVAVLINDRLDVALACGADGVHLGQSDLPASAARQLLGPKRILGVSCRTVDEARRAEAEGADYIGVGAVYATSTKASTAIGLAALAKICSSVRIPVVAIGGISSSNAAPAFRRAPLAWLSCLRCLRRKIQSLPRPSCGGLLSRLLLPEPHRGHNNKVKNACRSLQNLVHALRPPSAGCDQVGRHEAG